MRINILATANDKLFKQEDKRFLIVCFVSGPLVSLCIIQKEVKIEHEDSLETQNSLETHEEPKTVTVKKECPSPDKSNSTKHVDSEPVKSHSDINPE